MQALKLYRTRLSKHKSTKDFDSHLILNSYKSKKEALIAENSIIRFISIFGGEGWLNSKHWDLEIKGAILRNEYYKD